MKRKVTRFAVIFAALYFVPLASEAGGWCPLDEMAESMWYLESQMYWSHNIGDCIRNRGYDDGYPYGRSLISYGINGYPLRASDYDAYGYGNALRMWGF